MRLVRNDVIRILLYVAGCFLLACLISPHLYNAGKALGDMTAHKTTNTFIDWLGASARRAEYPRFFKRSLSLSALLLMPFLIFWLRISARRRIDEGNWQRFLPSDQGRYALGQPLEKNPHKWRHLAIGFAAAAPLLFLTGIIGTFTGAFEWQSVDDWGKVFRKSLTPAIFASVFEEIVFRGALLGIFIRCMGPLRGSIALSVLFAAVHFMIPPPGLRIESPESLNSGFRFLGLVLQRFLSPSDLISEFATILIVGLILAWTRFRTASLWLPIGLHIGWIFAFKFFNRLTAIASDSEDRSHFWIGTDLREGLLPLLALGVTAAFVYKLLNKQSKTSAIQRV